jgi:hypothetical protein
LFVDPKREWAVIAAEPADAARLYRQFILIVAAIPALALFVGMVLRLRPIVAIAAAATTYLTTIAQPILVALAVERLAPKFRSSGSVAQALKLVAYSSAPAWAAGMLYIIPALGYAAVAVAVIYGIYLFAIGLTPVLHTPREQVVPFMVVCAIVLLVVNILLSLVLSGPAYRWW